MSREQFDQVIKMLPGRERGIYFKGLNQVLNGTISISRKGLIKVPVSIPLDQLGAKVDDLRAALMPDAADNDLVPMLVFVEPKVYLETEPAPPHSDDLAVDRFAAAMKARMAEMRAKGKSGWDDPGKCPIPFLQGGLARTPLSRYVDVGNYAMMIFNRTQGPA